LPRPDERLNQIGSRAGVQNVKRIVQFDRQQRPVGRESVASARMPGLNQSWY
jgi:hypothetical protein